MYLSNTVQSTASIILNRSDKNVYSLVHRPLMTLRLFYFAVTSTLVEFLQSLEIEVGTYLPTYLPR